MKEYEHICKSEKEAAEGIANLLNAGYVQTANCYWVEWYEKGDYRHIVIRDF